MKIVLCSKFPWSEFTNYNCFEMAGGAQVGGAHGRAAWRADRCRLQFHVETLIIYNLGFNQNYYTFVLILLIKIVLCSKFPWTKFINNKCFDMKLDPRGVFKGKRAGTEINGQLRPYSLLFFFCITLEPRVEWYTSPWALNTSPPRNRLTFLPVIQLQERCVELLGKMERLTRKVDGRLPGKGNSNSHGARPVY